ncbi:(p)ppGpp synthetase [Christensenella minuta]|jgi:GTP pyrophosphokinase|nr:bifunctional (p)ppGpp synthetase/guanosine-3',5'-bis(diphosphate) 3'-pyrophosphohydrolase [Christensenella minuta]AYH41673.1 bifunctional (p)ppGpp synthetase/guanosine-3',5'-bis(diphosphate) 3'-pyrophosphohydrolase [Christensenella minuta]MDY3752255.1 bifunctional (p)ppGpp synthetase/guanosine-3',5'-bis(diphosphate) 3'-pyrophosphohydrolase [Christensenella minuta]OAQ43438.1 (p)ppGpp synthetase [Christensenella minuta]
MLEKAFVMAENAHAGQLRHSGEPFFTHPLAVADIVADLGLDTTTIVATILHDAVEDTQLTTEDIGREFTPEIAKLVDGVTKLNNYDFKTREEQQWESLRKMFLAMASDIRVVIIKLADRLHNMRTLKYQSENKQIEKATETLEIYAPLAHRLGISAIQWELEDLSLKFLHPDEYFEIANKIASTREEREKQINSVIVKLEDKFAEMKIKAEIEGRPKHIYSIYKKMREKHKVFEEVYDLIAIRIIVSSIKDCYGVLGIVHTMWKPIPLRFKDYIAVPKQNMYQSLHTTLLGEDGKPFEVQIRTYDMHRTAEYGIAAHWKYKEGGKESGMDSKLAWLRELMEWQNDLKDSKEFMETLKVDLFADNVFVFTPKGDVKDFVAGATPLDFAYSVHSAIGNKCVGAKINGKIVPLDYKLRTGDIVEIITSNSATPSRDWLKFVKTAQARSKIKQWFKKQLKEENIVKGREMLEKEAKRQGYNLYEQLLKPDWLSVLYKRFTLNSQDDMFAAIGYGALSANQILSKLIEQFKMANKIDSGSEELKIVKRTGKGAEEDITVEGNTGLAVRFAKCCNPVPGDDIIGYITRGRGVCVHTKECKNLHNVDKERLIEVAWAGDQTTSYNVEIQIVADDRPGLMVEIAQAMYNMGRDITAINAHSAKNGVATISLRSNITSVQDLHDLMNKLKALKGVRDVFRVNY